MMISSYHRCITFSPHSKFSDACKNSIVGGAAGAMWGGNIGKIFGIPGATIFATLGAGAGFLSGLFE